MIFRINNNYFS